MYGLILALSMVAILVPLIIRYERVGDVLATRGAPPSEALEYYRYLASEAVNRLGNEEATKEIERFQKQAARIGLTEPLV